MIRNILLTLILCLTSTLALAQEAPPVGAPPAPAAVEVVSPEAPAPVALPLTPSPSPSPEVAIPVPAAETLLIPVATTPPTLVPVQVPVEPADVASGVGQVVEAYSAGGWLAAGAAAVMLLTLLLRLFGLLDKLPKRARYLVPLALGCVSALLAAVAGGLPWGQAALLAFLTGPAAVGLHQGIARSLMGQDSPETAALKTAAGK